MRPQLLCALAMAASLGSCRVSANYEGAGFACSSTEPCQSGYACVQGLCESEGPRSDARASDAQDANTADAQMITCLPAIALSDEFDGDMLDPQWTPLLAQGTAVAVGAGVLTLSPRAESTPVRFARVQSVPFDFAEKRIFVEVVSMVDPEKTAVGQLQLGTQADTYYFLRQSQGVLQFGTTIAGTELIVSATAYEPAAHHWWQMRVTGGRVHADVSTDGVEWVNLDSVSADVIVGELYVEFSAGTTESVTAPGTMQVDKVNTTSGLCP